MAKEAKRYEAALQNGVFFLTPLTTYLTVTLRLVQPYPTMLLFIIF